MYIKWIVCEVTPSKKGAFPETQAQWKDLALAGGFIGQLGGWSVGKPTQACILGFWQSIELHNNYTKQLLPKLREDATIDKDIEEIDRKINELEDSWTVL